MRVRFRGEAIELRDESAGLEKCGMKMRKGSGSSFMKLLASSFICYFGLLTSDFRGVFSRDFECTLERF